MTSTQTPHLDLPYIMPGQAQKHVTYNEAVRRLDAVTHMSVAAMDVSVPISDPVQGARYGLSDMPSGDWSAYPAHIAVWQDGAWLYLLPQDGWTVWTLETQDFQIFSDAAWHNLLPPEPTEFDNLDHVGINASADSGNRLSVASDASLFSHSGTGHQVKVNKNALANMASVLFQTGFSGRAEIGLIGDDALSMKTSADGATWDEQLTIEAEVAGIKTPALRSGTVTVGVDSIAEISVPAPGGVILVTLTSASGYPQSYHTGLFVYDTGPSLTLLTLAKLAGIDNLGQTALTGTMGGANQTSISVQTGLIQIENRYGQARDYTYSFLA
ncbi:MAG: DUF2793 domain-containing protein [Alphaproteobacteria bacterium]